MQICRCGHELTAHEHYRAGTDCAQCDCARFRDRQPLPAALKRLVEVLRRA
jgi:hypothetical protein